MQVKDLKKDVHKSVRINSEVLEIIENQGFTLQGFLDTHLEKSISVEIKDCQLITGENNEWFFWGDEKYNWNARKGLCRRYLYRFLDILEAT